MQNDQIKQMTERFLSWELPENFNPDDGISFEPVANKGTVYERRRQPTGTNLFDYTQAEAMVRYMVEGLERTSSTKEGPSEGWCITMARLEGDAEISAGAIDHPLRCPPLGAPTTDSTDLEARLRDFLTRATPDWVIYSEPDVGLPPSLFAGTPGQTGFRPLEPLEGYDLNLAVEAVNAVPSLLDTLASQRAEITQLHDKLARTREELNALQDAERTYRQEHDLHGEGSWEANYAWDVMRRKGDAARQALKDTQP